jgi:hypothetical protein
VTYPAAIRHHRIAHVAAADARIAEAQGDRA